MGDGRWKSAIVGLAAAASWPASALAGMPAPYVMTDIARMRVEALSFFLLVFLLSALGIKLLWNHLRRTFLRLPRLTYGKALALVAIWGLLFVLILLMISGARELMTPGAWERDGAIYKLKEKG